MSEYYKGHKVSELEKLAKHEARDVTDRIMKKHGEHWIRVKVPSRDGGYEIIHPDRPKNEMQRKFVDEIRKHSRCNTKD